jgi:ATP-binding cassette subfamily B (MDR/TAP) protein 1
MASAIIASIVAGFIKPTSAIIFGQLFNALTDYGAGAVDASVMLDRISKWCIALTALGGATWILEWALLSLWLIFGEIQAKSIRQRMFAGMLEKNIEWYDLREDGIASLLSRLET